MVSLVALSVRLLYEIKGYQKENMTEEGVQLCQVLSALGNHTSYPMEAKLLYVCCSMYTYVHMTIFK